MYCAVAVPLRVSPLFYKLSVSPPVTLNLHASPSSQSTPSHSSPTSPLSPLTLRLNNQPEDEPVFSSSSTTTTTLLTTATSGPALMKRKRPAMIEIPSLALSFAATEAPAEVGPMDEVEVDGEGYYVCCKRGKRRAMEDRYSAVVNSQGDSKQAFFGVFDGHGGAKAAEFAANNIGRNIMKEVTRRREEEIEEAVKDGYLTTDAEFLKEGASGGTCCVTALIREGDLVVSNAGDCRAVLSRGAVAEALTADHRPCREDERDRIENTGGYVDCCRGVWRIQGSLAVSRGLGDQHLKNWVVAEPETKVVRLTPECEFLILASDGLWDKVSNQEAVDVVRHSCVGIDNLEPFSACKKLVDLSVTRGSIDDISVLVIQLAHFIP
ncbi:probable protein phosphatase 2C 2 [Rhododendron vialii]|uniref:probable protein phosphatase 2C 2 n=1 Tax=Rhododendron vialii TaxID=182163 RepID=UPI00265DD2DA|nr:probable protein phosphatase 2C 2 [Rhododendron vialii]